MSYTVTATSSGYSIMTDSFTASDNTCDGSALSCAVGWALSFSYIAAIIGVTLDFVAEANSHNSYIMNNSSLRNNTQSLAIAGLALSITVFVCAILSSVSAAFHSDRKKCLTMGILFSLLPVGASIAGVVFVSRALNALNQSLPTTPLLPN